MTRRNFSSESDFTPRQSARKEGEQRVTVTDSIWRQLISITRVVNVDARPSVRWKKERNLNLHNGNLLTNATIQCIKLSESFFARNPALKMPRSTKLRNNFSGSREREKKSSLLSCYIYCERSFAFEWLEIKRKNHFTAVATYCQLATTNNLACGARWIISPNCRFSKVYDQLFSL